MNIDDLHIDISLQASLHSLDWSIFDPPGDLEQNNDFDPNILIVLKIFCFFMTMRILRQEYASQLQISFK